MDRHTPLQRSFNMQQVKSKNTKPEILVRKLLWNNGYRYRLHFEKLPGKPDIVFPRKKKVIFIHGCFWHKHNCSHFKWPKTNTAFWKEKINQTVERDQRNLLELTKMGWDALVIWECETKKDNHQKLNSKLFTYVNS